MTFISCLKLFSLRDLDFCPYFFDQIRKQPDKKAKVNCKIYGVTAWTTNTYTVQYLK